MQCSSSTTLVFLLFCSIIFACLPVYSIAAWTVALFYIPPSLPPSLPQWLPAGAVQCSSSGSPSDGPEDSEEGAGGVALMAMGMGKGGGSRLVQSGSRQPMDVNILHRGK